MYATNAQTSADFRVAYDPIYQCDPDEPFNPYVSADSGVVPSTTTTTTTNLRQSLLDALGSAEGPRADAKSSSEAGAGAGERTTGFSVVSGYLDRSEDAMRRWTLGMADVPDDVLVHHLERLRKESQAFSRGRLPGRRSATPSQAGHGDDVEAAATAGDTHSRRTSFFFGSPREMGIRSPRSPSSSRAHFSLGHYDHAYDDAADSDDDEEASDDDGGEEDEDGDERD